MSFFAAWFLLACTQLAATMSPGPAFVICVRNSIAYDRRVGIMTSLGLAFGVAAHVVFVLCGISYLIQESVIAYNLIKYVGAAYLVYVGIKSIYAKKREDVPDQEEIVKSKNMISSWAALRIGFLTNLLNPKAVLFFTAVYSQFIDQHTPLLVHAIYGVTSAAIEFLWFVGVAIVLTNPDVKKKFMRIVHIIERGCGGLMIALGLKLALSK